MKICESKYYQYLHTSPGLSIYIYTTGTIGVCKYKNTEKWERLSLNSSININEKELPTYNHHRGGVILLDVFIHL